MRHSQFAYAEAWTLFRSEIFQFLAVAESKNISKASEVLGITQPQLSKAMAGLEANWGEVLLIRKSRGVELTLAGQALLERIQHLKKAWELEDQKDAGFRRLRFGFHHSIAMKAYPLVIHPLNLDSNHLQFETEFGTSLEITRKVADLQIDFGLVINPQKNPDVVAKRLEADFVAIWNKGKAPIGGILYFHPDMLNVHRLLKKMTGFQKIPIADYEVIAQVVASQKNALGILPQSVARRFGLDAYQQEKLFSVDVMLIAHREKLKSPEIKSMFQKIQTLYSADAG